MQKLVSFRASHDPLHVLTDLHTGKDATEAFEDVGHSDEARDVLKGLYIGDFDGADVRTH